jgi:dTDP-4-amino-4,6-dideoxygalactose transaminase
MTRLYLSPPHMGADELGLLEDAFRSNWIAPLGPQLDAFEREFASAVGVPHAAALSSGTAALHLALQVLGVGRGDTVLCSTLTFVASASPITWMGAEPVFVDCSRETWNLDPSLVDEALASLSREGKTPRAVVAVDLYGQVADLEPIGESCRRHGVELVEDAAEALGATYRGRSAGSLGRIGVFSFNGNKIITTSGGGMLVSAEKALVQRARFLAQQARDPGPQYEHSVLGNNYRMSNLLAAVGRGQMRVLPQRVERKRAIFEAYRSALAGTAGIEFMPEASYGRATRWLTVILIDPAEFGATREDVWLHLEAQNIESRPVWKPMHLQPVFRGCRVIGGGVAAHLFERGLCLPCGTQMTDADVTRVVEGLLATRRRRVAARSSALDGAPARAASPHSAGASEGEPLPLQMRTPLPRPVPGRPLERRSWRSRLLRRQTSVGFDLVVMGAAFWLAFLLRFDFDVPASWRGSFVTQLPLALATQLTALYVCGVLSFVWKYVGMAEVPAFLRAALGSATTLLAFRLFLPEPLSALRIPMSIIVMNAVLAFGGLLGLRVARRFLWEREVRRRRAVAGGPRRRPPVLLVGAGAVGVMAAREIRSRGEQDLDLRGFVDDDPDKRGAVISGIRVLGSTEDLPALVPALGIEQVIVTIAEAPEEEMSRILAICGRIPVPVQTVPALYDLLQGRVSVAM